MKHWGLFLVVLAFTACHDDQPEQTYYITPEMSGIAAVQEVVGSIAYYKADRAMVVTNSNFTKSARDLAKRNEVELWGRKEMQKKFHIKA